MLPPGHAAFAYLWYVAVTVVGTRRPPVGAVLVPLLVASQLPDLIDKPLVFVGLLASGRSLAHSLFALVVFSSAAALACRALRDAVDDERAVALLRRSPVAFATGYASHLAGDASGALSGGAYAEASFLLFPFVSAPQYPADAVAPWVRLARIYGSGALRAFSPLVVAALVLFVGAHVWARWRGQ